MWRQAGRDLLPTAPEQNPSRCPPRSMGLTLPKMLRPYFLFHRELLGELARLSYQTVREMMAEAADESASRPGRLAVIQTFGSSLKWNHTFMPSSPAEFTSMTGRGYPSPMSTPTRPELLFRHKVLRLLRDRGLITQERIDLLLSWRTCARCGARMKILAFIFDPKLIRPSTTSNRKPAPELHRAEPRSLEAPTLWIHAGALPARPPSTLHHFDFRVPPTSKSVFANPTSPSLPPRAGSPDCPPPPPRLQFPSRSSTGPRIWRAGWLEISVSGSRDRTCIWSAASEAIPA